MASMKLTAIGDIHGREVWQKIVAEETRDRLIFIGDYVDTHEGIPPSQQLRNFQRIIDFKQRHPGQVVLLIGNHDFHYMNFTGRHYSGYQPAMAQEFGNLYRQALEEDLMQMCFWADGFLFTHAGITRTWANTQEIDLSDPEKSLNHKFRTEPEAFEFRAGPNADPTGDDITQSPLWVRPRSLMKDSIEKYAQVVGHTVQLRLQHDSEVYFIDTLGTSGEYLMINDGEVAIRRNKRPDGGNGKGPNTKV